MSDDRDTLAQAVLLVDAFIERHHAPAIPALIGACVGWAVEHGGADVMRRSLENAIVLSHNAERAWRQAQQ